VFEADRRCDLPVMARIKSAWKWFVLDTWNIKMMLMLEIEWIRQRGYIVERCSIDYKEVCSERL